MNTVNFKLNSKKVCCEVDGKETLVDTLRGHFGLTGTKKACGTGDCGACTVLINDLAVRSCTYLTCMVEGKDVITIEGIGTKDNLHPIQQAFIEVGAVQCGFCTPGMVLSAYALLKVNQKPTADDVRVALSGNLCRCTGYDKIIEAVLLAADRMYVK